MNNDLEQFSEERLKQLASGKYAGTGLGIQNREVESLARIALAAKQATPAKLSPKKPNHAQCCAEAGGDPRYCDCVNKDHVYLSTLDTTPQPAHTERDGWIKCSDRMPTVGDVVLTAYQGATNIGEMERSGKDYRYFTSIVSGRELPADFWMPLPAAPKPESE